MVMIHPYATALLNPFSRIFYAVGESPETQFWGRFNRLCQVPMRQEWSTEMWRLGVGAELIRPLPGVGVFEGYEIDVGDDWQGVVKRAILKGEIK